MNDGYMNCTYLYHRLYIIIAIQMKDYSLPVSTEQSGSKSQF